MQRRAEPDNWNEFPLSPNLMRESKFRGPVPKRNLFGADSDVKGQSTVIHCMATISATPANILSGAANGASSGGQRDADSNSAQQPGVQKKSMGTRQLFAGMMPTQQQMEAFFSTAEEKEKLRFKEHWGFDVTTGKPVQGHKQWDWVTEDPAVSLH